GILGVVPASSQSDAAGPAVSERCPGPGWCELSGTRLIDACPLPSPGGIEGCQGVLSYSGAVADTSLQRLLVWGGGTTNYWGNEVYALDLMSASLRRLTDPSALDTRVIEALSEEYPDGMPRARSSFNGLVYVAAQNRLLAFGGDRAVLDNGVSQPSNAVWALGLSALEWTRLIPAGALDPSYVMITDIDPRTQRVYVVSGQKLYAYAYESGTVTLLRDFEQFPGEGLDYHMVAVVDSKRQRLFFAGGDANTGADTPGGLKSIDLRAGTAYALEDWTEDARRAGCAPLIEANNPGFVYDSTRDRLVGWAGGDDVFVLDADARTCTVLHYAGGPTSHPTGTYGRFRYFPKLDVFAVVSDAHRNAFVLRLPP
ncbi:MAG TPA: hypothetical protein VK524_00060, partial [Polyangiaceae bacterium]|nr:hypothetical protein [Polyangiaceae bacterium]